MSDLPQKSVVKHFFTTAADGKKYSTNFYNLDVIISVGYPLMAHDDVDVGATGRSPLRRRG